MKKTKKKKHVHIAIEDIKKALKQRERQLAFDKYPKPFQEYLTKRGLNPYITDVDDQIEYKVSYIVEVKNKDHND